MKIFASLNKTKSVALHTFFWALVWLFYIYFFGFNTETSSYVIWFSNILIPVTILTTYFVIYFLIPKYLLEKKYWLFTLYGFYTLIASAYLITIAMFAGFMFKTDLDMLAMPPLSRSLPFILVSVYFVVFIVASFKLLKYNYDAAEKNKALENKILETQLKIKEQELHYLKKQIHPHFLFNTLNTIYGLALKQSANTPEIILKLSNLLDYILYQVNKPMVSLKEEVKHIKEYIALEKIRFQDSLNVSFMVENIPDDILIAPMLLVPFVENAFKHGSLIDGILIIEIKLKMKDNQLLFSIRNTVSESEKNKSKDGIGLLNIQKRLDLLYKNNHLLEISNNSNWYSINLSISNINS